MAAVKQHFYIIFRSRNNSCREAGYTATDWNHAAELAEKDKASDEKIVAISKE